MDINKFVLVLLSASLVLGLVQCFEFHESDLASEESLWDLYERWRAHHTISRDLVEKERRFNVFKANVHHVHKVNKMDKPYKLKLNTYADMTNHEFRASYGSKIAHHRMFHPRPVTEFMHGKIEDIPASVDWRTKGAVTPVKNQRNCGSCWAFSTIASVEGINQIKTKQLLSLSEQELVDCDHDNYGCEGGLVEHAFSYIKKSGGVVAETTYPYEAKNDICNSAKANAPVVKIDGYEVVPENDENALLKAVANQPVSVAIDASGSDLQFYSEGVFSGECGTDLDHAVTAVGYGTTQDGTKYWIVKNSWGPGWGEKGYIRMQRGVDAKEGLCGIAMDACYPTKLSSDNPHTAESAKDEL
ncbi:hypothetical protein BVRB_6g147350 [Beta vulgaris subsp. vulgaris]|nr:hypothetical protein BVRB_6g147350 [Beta vulgaris subsp. vulgaris]